MNCPTWLPTIEFMGSIAAPIRDVGILETSSIERHSAHFKRALTAHTWYIPGGVRTNVIIGAQQY